MLVACHLTKTGENVLCWMMIPLGISGNVNKWLVLWSWWVFVDELTPIVYKTLSPCLCVVIVISQSISASKMLRLNWRESCSFFSLASKWQCAISVHLRYWKTKLGSVIRTAHTIHSLLMTPCFVRFIRSRYSKPSFNEITFKILYNILTEAHVLYSKLIYRGVFSDFAKYEAANLLETAWWSTTPLACLHVNLDNQMVLWISRHCLPAVLWYSGYIMFSL